MRTRRRETTQPGTPPGPHIGFSGVQMSSPARDSDCADQPSPASVNPPGGKNRSGGTICPFGPAKLRRVKKFQHGPEEQRDFASANQTNRRRRPTASLCGFPCPRAQPPNRPARAGKRSIPLISSTRRDSVDGRNFERVADFRLGTVDCMNGTFQDTGSLQADARDAKRTDEFLHAHHSTILIDKNQVDGK